MHKYFAQLKNFNIFNFESYGINILYFLLESEMNMYFDLYTIQEDFGYDMYKNQFTATEYYHIGNGFCGCGEDGFYNGDGNNYPSDLCWETDNE